MKVSKYDSLHFYFLLNAYVFRCPFSKVFAFLPFPNDSVSKLAGSALAQCNAAGLTSSLPEALPNIIYGKYESLVRSAPWDRHSNTMDFKRICATLRVRTF